MSIQSCIQELSGTGKLGPKQQERAEDSFQRHYRRLINEMSPESAAAEASQLALTELERETQLAKRQVYLQASAQQRIASDLSRYDGDIFGASKAILASDERAPFMNVESQAKVILGRAHAKLESVLDRHSRDIAGRTRNQADLQDMVREAFGENTNNVAAKEINEAWQEAAEYLRQRYNRAGGSIAKRPDWGLPQSHDMLRVREAGVKQWKDFLSGRLNLEKMVDDATGLPFTPDRLDEALSNVYMTISSDGWIKREPGQFRTGKLASRRNDPRFLVFKTADDWMAYEQRFGTGNAFEAMMGHVDGMARDIALMEVMGPNPRASLRWLQDVVKRNAATDLNATPQTLNRARSADKALGDLYDVVAGQLNSPVNEVWARRMGGVRSFLTSTMLGAAQLSAVTDIGFQAVTRKFNGLPVAGAMTDYLKLLNPGNRSDRKLAVSLGLVAEEASKRAASLSRYADSEITPGIAGRLADGVLRASGLSAWTQAGRWGFGMSVLSHLASERHKGFASLDAGLRGMMERYGIDAAGWDVIRHTEVYRHEGGQWLRPDDVQNERLGDAMLRMVLTETDYAVPAATARSRAALSFGQRPGTFGGELLRSGVMFKSFGVALILTHGARMMRLGAANRAKYAAGLFITTTLLGGLAMQLKEISKGRTPEDMNNPEFWARAAVQGGGFGIFGDFVQASQNRFGGGFAETLAGPVAGTVGDVLRVGGKMIGDAADPEKDVNPNDALNLGKNFVPGQSLWYARAAFQRVVLDQIQREIDPNYDQSWARVEKAMQDRGQDYWWPPGEMEPAM